MAEEDYDYSAYQINEDGEFQQINNDEQYQSNLDFGYTQHDYTETQPSVQIQPTNLNSAYESISAKPSMNIGPEFKQTKAGPQKTANTMNVIYY
jgi:hypothetical protein